MARPAGAAAVAPAQKEPARYKVHSSGDDGDDFVIQTLVGDFVENGNNHSRPTYQKAAAKPGTSPPEVFLYFWDNRDGADFEGWWFGKSVGGNEVWSHNQSKALRPPSAGWKIPFAGGIRPTFHVQSQAAQQAVMQKTEKSEAIKKLQVDAAAAITDATAALTQAKEALEGEPTAEAVTEVEQLLSAHVQTLTKTVKQGEPLQATAGPALTELRAGLQKMRTTVVALNQTNQKIRMMKPKLLAKAKAAEAQSNDMSAMAEMLLDAVEKANAAEDIVEKTSITYETVEAAGDDQAEALRAVDETQGLATQSQMRIKEALALIGRKMVTIKSFTSDAVKERANTELNSLRTKLRDANQKLTPLLSVKQDFAQLAHAKKIVKEVNDKLAPAELCLDRAVEAAEPLTSSGSWPTKAIMKQAETAINVAQDNLSGAVNFLQVKLKPSQGLVRRELEKVEVRAKAAEKRLAELRNSHRAVHEKEATSNLLSDVGEKMKAVSEATQKCQEVLGPYLMGVEAPGEAQGGTQSADDAMKVANKATSAARIVISMRMVEVKRFTAEAGQEAQRTLQEYQKELEVAMVKLNELKSAISERKQVMVRAEAMNKVEAVEVIAQRVGENGAIICDPEKLKDLSAAQVREAGDACASGFQESQELIRQAQQILTSRQVDCKNLDDAEQGAELAGLQQRLREAQSTIQQYKTLPASVMKQVAQKRQVDEAVGKVAAAEEKIDEAVAKIDAIGDETQGPVNPEAASFAASQASVAMKGVARYLDVQLKTNKVSKEEIDKLQERVKSGEERLQAAQSQMRESADRLTSKNLVQEVETQVKSTEEASEDVVEACALLMKDGEEEEGAAEKLKEINEMVKDAEAAANKAVSSSKTLIAVKKGAAKRLAQAVSDSTLADLDVLQGRLDSAAEKAANAKRRTVDKKYVKAKEEVNKKWASVEQVVKSATDQADNLVASGEDAKDEDVDKTLKWQQEAQTALTEGRALLQANLKEMKAGESTIHAEFSQLLVKAGSLQGQLDKHKKVLNERQQKAVHRVLMKEAALKFGELEGQMEKAEAAAKPLTGGAGDEPEDFTGAMYLGKVMEALLARSKKTSKSKEDMFDEIRGDEDTVSAAKFVAFVKGLPELQAIDGPGLGEAQIKKSYARLDTIGGGQVAKHQFTDQFRQRFVCAVVVAMTDTAALEGAKILRKLDIHEEVEGIGEPVKDEASGIMRVKVRAEKDEVVGYVAMKSNAGTVFLEPYSAYEACLRQIEGAVKKTSEAIEQTMTYLKEKADELGKMNLGPLGEAKAELMKMRMRASKAQSSHTALKKKVAEAQKGHAEQLEVERRRKAEAAEKATADHMVDEATKLADTAVAEAEKGCAAAEALAGAEAKHDGGNPLEAMSEAARNLSLSADGVTQALQKIMQDNMGEIRKVEKGPFVEARRLMFRLKVKLQPMETRCKKAATALQDAQARVSDKAQQAISATLRASIQADNGLSADALFAKLSKDSTHIAVTALRAYLEGLDGDLKLQASQLDLGLHRYSAGFTRLGLLGMLQEYQRCVKDIALTSAFEVKSSQTLRKLEKGEILEILGGHGKDEAVGLERVRCRALKDAQEGWVTSRGNQGTAFLEATDKPYFILDEVKDECLLQKACESGSETVCKLQAGDVLEVFAGPCKEPPLEVVRVRGKAKKDGKLGWATMKEYASATPNLELTKLMVCKASVALTDNFDVKSCTSIRKLEVGEMLEQVEASQEDGAQGIARVHVKALSDGKDGWATLKGNAGTVFIAESSGYACRRSIPLEAQFASGSKTIRTLEEGEIFDVLEGPSTETKQGAMRARGRSLRTGKDGWLAHGSHVQRWCPRHVCAKAVALRDGADAATAKTIRTLGEGERLEALEGPVSSGAEGALQLHVRADKDGTMGYAEVRASAKGDVYLRSAVEEASP